MQHRDIDGILKHLLDADPERGVILLAADQKVLYANAAARGLLRSGSSPGGGPELVERLAAVFESFLDRVKAQHGVATAEAWYPSEEDRRVRVTFQSLSRDDTLYVVVRALSAIPWSEPTVRRLQVRFGLTVREAQVAAAVARGHSNPEIAAILGIVEKTVKNTLMAVFDKCGVRNRVELALRVYDAPLRTSHPK